jgi:hypothetical protein
MRATVSPSATRAIVAALPSGTPAVAAVGFAAEMARHLPGLAPAIRALAEHLHGQHPEEVGRCCTGPDEVLGG